MKKQLIFVMLSVLCAGAAALTDVPTPADITIKADPSVTTTITRRVGNTSKAISITVNKQDKVTIVTAPPVMPPMVGNYIDLTTIPKYNNGINEERVSNIGQFPNPSEEGGFRTVCGPASNSNDDPLVFPGQPGASHNHTFFGNTGINAFSTAATIANSGGSTCRGGTVNRTGYWVPSMEDNGKYIVPQSIIVYYKNNPRLEQSFHPTYAAFPPGLRMIAGNSKGMMAADAGGSFTCIDSSGSGSHNPGIPACAPGNTLWQSVEFPSCWDGKNLDSPDHKSHVVYVEQKQSPPFTWSCPTTHPVLLPTITTNVLYGIKPGQDTTKWKLASDMGEAGTSNHSDWWNGWKADINAAWVAGCNNAQKDCQAQMLGDGRVLDSFGANE